MITSDDLCHYSLFYSIKYILYVTYSLIAITDKVKCHAFEIISKSARLKCTLVSYNTITGKLDNYTSLYY